MVGSIATWSLDLREMTTPGRLSTIALLLGGFPLVSRPQFVSIGILKGS